MATLELEKQIEDQIKMREGWVRESYAKRELLRPFAKSLNALLRLVPDSAAEFYCDKITIRMKVKDMKETAPLLESLEETIGKEFGRTTDETVYGASRTFSMTGFPLEVIADVSQNDETANCHRVQVGEEIVPKYELRCGDQA